MNNLLIKLFLTLTLIFSFNLATLAHQGHGNDDDGDNGGTLNNGTTLISNHRLAGTWTAKSTITNSSLKFHAGHEHQPKPRTILTLDLCGNGDTLVGTVEQIKLIEAPKKLDVESATITTQSSEATEYSVLLNSRRDSNVATNMHVTATDIANQIIISFDNGETSYTANLNLKKPRASGRCLELLNPEHEDESDD